MTARSIRERVGTIPVGLLDNPAGVVVANQQPCLALGVRDRPQPMLIVVAVPEDGPGPVVPGCRLDDLDQPVVPVVQIVPRPPGVVADLLDATLGERDVDPSSQRVEYLNSVVPKDEPDDIAVPILHGTDTAAACRGVEPGDHAVAVSKNNPTTILRDDSVVARRRREACALASETMNEPGTVMDEEVVVGRLHALGDARRPAPPELPKPVGEGRAVGADEGEVQPATR